MFSRMLLTTGLWTGGLKTNMRVLKHIIKQVKRLDKKITHYNKKYMED